MRNNKNIPEHVELGRVYRLIDGTPVRPQWIVRGKYRVAHAGLGRVIPGLFYRNELRNEVAL